MAKSPLPDIPIATMGWDSSMRCRNDVKLPWPEGAKYPYSMFYINNTPDIFEEILAKAKAFALADPRKPGAVLINAWNEYTEGSYLLPDIRDGDGYLRAVASVFGRRPAGEYVYFDCATKNSAASAQPILKTSLTARITRTNWTCGCRRARRGSRPP